MTTNPSYEPYHYGDENNVPLTQNIKQPYRCDVHRKKQRDLQDDQQPDEKDEPTHVNKEDEPIHVNKADDPIHINKADEPPDDDHHTHRNCNFGNRDYPIHPYWVPGYHPYHFPSRDMCQPAFMPETLPAEQPFYRYDMRAQPYNMYDPMDMYHPRYAPWPGGYCMPPTRQRQPRDSLHAYQGKRQPRAVGFQDEVEEEYFDPDDVDPYLIEEEQKSQIKVRLALLFVIVILLIASLILGAVAAALEPWWLHEKKSGTTTFDSLKVGLWRTCYRSDHTKSWECHKYSEEGKYRSTYKSLALLQWSMIVGIIAVVIALILAIITIFGRKSSYVRPLIFTMIFFIIGATVLFGLVIGYVNEDKDTKLVGEWVKESAPLLKTSVMFAVGCAATATTGLALILCCVVAFTYEPYRKSAYDVMQIEKINDSTVKGNKKVEKKDTKSTKKEGNLNESTVKGNKKVEKKNTKSPKKEETSYQSSDVQLISEPALITEAKQDLEETNSTDSDQTQKEDELPQSGEPSVPSMKPRDHYALEGVASNDYESGMAARPKKHKELKGGPPSYFKRSPGNGTATMLKPNNAAYNNATKSQPAYNNATYNVTKSQPEVKQVEVKQVKHGTSKEIAIYGGDYNSYFDEPY